MLTPEDMEGRELRAYIEHRREVDREVRSTVAERLAPLDAKLAAMDADIEAKFCERRAKRMAAKMPPAEESGFEEWVDNPSAPTAALVCTDLECQVCELPEWVNELPTDVPPPVNRIDKRRLEQGRTSYAFKPGRGPAIPVVLAVSTPPAKAPTPPVKQSRPPLYRYYPPRLPPLPRPIRPPKPPKPRKLYSLTCDQCGDSFVSQWKIKARCSDECDIAHKAAKTKMYAERREQRALTPDDVRDRHRECGTIELSKRDHLIRAIMSATGVGAEEAMRLAQNGYSLCSAKV
jgi:hypothetical protein